MIRILIVGTGGMAATHVKSLAVFDDVAIVGGVDPDPVRLAEFCDAHNITNRFTHIDQALEFGEFDAVTNVTPDAVHYATTLPFLAAGKHIMCEKPLATDAKDAHAMRIAAEQAGVVNMVNLTYRRGEAMQRAAQMVAEGAVGEIRHFDASYLQSWLVQDRWGYWQSESQWLWRLSKKHGSHGVLGDVGVHILDYLTYVAGQGIADISCRLKTFDKAPANQIGEYQLDANDSALMHIGLIGGATGVVHATRFASGHINDLSLQIHGTKGGLDMGERDGVSYLCASIGEDVKAGEWREITLHDEGRPNFEAFIAAIRDGKAGTPDFARGAQLQAALDTATKSAEKNGVILPVTW